MNGKFGKDDRLDLLLGCDLLFRVSLLLYPFGEGIMDEQKRTECGYTAWNKEGGKVSWTRPVTKVE